MSNFSNFLAGPGNCFQLRWTQKAGGGGHSKNGFFSLSPLSSKEKAQLWCFGLPVVGRFAAHTFHLFLILKMNEKSKKNTHTRCKVVMSSLYLRFSHKLQCNSNVLTLHFTSKSSLDFYMHYLNNHFIISTMIMFIKIRMIGIFAVSPVTGARPAVFLSSALILTCQTHQTDKWFVQTYISTRRQPPTIKHRTFSSNSNSRLVWWPVIRFGCSFRII